MTNLPKTIGGLTVGLQSLAVMSKGLELVPKEKDFISKKPLKQSKKMVKGFVDIMTGMALIKPTANIVSNL